MKEKKMIKKIYTTPKKFAECIDSIFSNNYEEIAEFNNVEVDRSKITVDMLIDWLNERKPLYADYIGFFDSFYEEMSETANHQPSKYCDECSSEQFLACGDMELDKVRPCGYKPNSKLE